MKKFLFAIFFLLGCFFWLTAQDVKKSQTQESHVYCRSGRRSKEASQKLVAYSYTNVIEIGGILDYSGTLEK